jgi:hypothetical protein
MYILAIFFITILSYLFGSVLFKYSQIEISNRPSNFFIKIVLGILFIVPVYALLKTNGNSILFGIPLLYFIAWFYKNGKKTDYSFDWKLFLGLLGIQLIFLLLFRFIVFPYKELIPNDILFYGAISDYLSQFGFENTSMNIHNPEGVKIYHYFNEWFAAIFSDILGLTGSLSLAYIVYPFVYSLMFIGVWAIVTLFKPKWSNLKVLVAVILFFLVNQFWGGASVPSVMEIKGISFRPASLFLTVNYIKLSILIVLFLPAIIFYKTKNYSFLCFSLLIMPFIWPTTLFGIFGGLILYTIYFFVNQKKINYSLLIQLIAAIIFFFSFYKVNSVVFPSNTESSSHSNLIFTFFEIKEALLIFPKIIVSRIFYFSLFLLILVLNWKKLMELYKQKEVKLKQYILIFLMFFFSAMFGNMIFHFQLDSDQIFGNIIDNVFLKVISFLLIINTLDSVRTKAILFLFLIMNFVQLNLYLKNIRSRIDFSINEKLYDFIGSEKATFALHLIASPNESKYKKISQTVYPPLTTIRSFNRSYFPQNISILDRAEYYTNVIRDSIQFNGIKNKSSFYKYHTLNPSLLETSSVKYEYLKEHKFDYLIYENRSLDGDLLNLLNLEDLLVLDELDVSVAKLKW